MTMNNHLVSHFHPLTFNINRAYQSLKEWCDPAFEGHPYIVEKIKSDKTSRHFRFGLNRRFLFK